jgi:hypothetical protein
MTGAYPWAVRRLLGLLAGLLVTVLGAAILGEYQFNGFTGVVAGLIFGLFVAEVIVSVAREGNAVFAVICAAFTAGGLGWAVHASIGARGHVPALAWVAIALGAAAAAFRGRSSGSAAGRTQPEP